MREVSSRKRLTFAALAIVALAATFGFWSWGDSGPERSEAANQQAKTEMHLEIDGSFIGAVHCDSRTQTTCQLLKGTTFTLHVVPSAIPVGGYATWQALIEYGDLLYKAQPGELKWDNSFLPKRSPASPTGSTTSRPGPAPASYGWRTFRGERSP